MTEKPEFPKRIPLFSGDGVPLVHPDNGFIVSWESDAGERHERPGAVWAVLTEEQMDDLAERVAERVRQGLVPAALTEEEGTS